MSCRPVTAWLFGKLPTHGDFVSRGLSAEARDRFDGWLSDEMNAARARFDEVFEDRFDSAPPWLFARDGEGGALCPSIDAAGRRFPLLVGCAATKGASSAAAEACLERLYEAFEEKLSADALADSLTSAALPAGAEPRLGWWNSADPGDAIVGDWPSGLLTRMLEFEPA